LSHGYNGRQLFKDVDLEIEQGERVAIIGPNGAGKSTLLRLIMGKEQPNKGRVSVLAECCVIFFFFACGDVPRGFATLLIDVVVAVGR
jgi:ATPase subunit of ABC transporter with duplicated ATPase domains